MLSKKSFLLLNSLVALKTVGDDVRFKRACFSLIGKYLGAGFQNEKYSHRGKESILFYPIGQNKKFDILILTHIDVVDGEDDHFKVKMDGDRIYGRGVFDMKGPLVVAVEALKVYYSEGGRKINIGLLITSDEEKGGYDGAGFIVRNKMLSANVVIVPDGGTHLSEIVIEEKGVLEAELSLEGESFHVSRPSKGQNVAERLARLIDRILEHYQSKTKSSWRTTAALTSFHSESVAKNVTPDSALANINFRFVHPHSPETIIKVIKQLDSKVSVREVIRGDALKANIDHELFNVYRRIHGKVTGDGILSKYQSACDGRFFASVGVPVIINRPTGGEAHGNEEWISARSMNLFLEMLLKYFGEIESGAYL